MDLIYNLTYAEQQHIARLNAKNHWGLTHAQLAGLITKHEKARANNDARTMALIEERLTDINFHTECGMIMNGRYSEARKEAIQFYAD